jgi:uncharacterized membrane protein (DUF485 family)
MRRGILGIVAIGSAALGLWSLWNPGYYYLGRATLFILIGAGAVYLWMGHRHRRYAFAASFVYVALLLVIAAVGEWIAAPVYQVESLSLMLLPLAAVFLAAAILTAVSARFWTRPIEPDPERERS